MMMTLFQKASHDHGQEHPGKRGPGEPRRHSTPRLEALVSSHKALGPVLCELWVGPLIGRYHPLAGVSLFALQEKEVEIIRKSRVHLSGGARGEPMFVQEGVQLSVSSARQHTEILEKRGRPRRGPELETA
jgi:hypothetical protein